MIVLDASVILKWFLKDDDSPRATEFLESHIVGDNQVAVPEILYYEIANALITKTRFSEKDIIAALRNLLELDLVGYSLGMDEYIRAAQLAARSRITIHDASYPVLAERLGVDFLTTDMKLLDSLKGLKFVKAL